MTNENERRGPVSDWQVVMIALPTPSHPEGGYRRRPRSCPDVGSAMIPSAMIQVHSTQ